jgi:hypothetical protein
VKVFSYNVILLLVTETGQIDMNADGPHTKVPNLIYDIVIWLVTPPERDCLLYIVRRTYGFSDQNGGRKVRDTISLDQFEKGIVSDSFLLDLGTQLSRNTIRKALKELENKELVVSKYYCTHCFWEEDDQSKPAIKDDKTNAIACPRCRASVSKSWGLASLTPRKLKELLNNNDKQHRHWDWDSDRQRFKFHDVDLEKEKALEKQSLEEEAKRLRGLLWYPDLIDKAIEMAARKLKSNKISISRKINGFYRPVWEMQEKFNNPPLIKFALEKTLEGPVFKGNKTQNWHRYMLRVAENNTYRFPRAGDQAAIHQSNNKDHQELLRDKELAMRQLLLRAAELNGRKEHHEARALLSDILSQVNDLSELFENDQQKCEYNLRLAFKQGEYDFVSVKIDPYISWDFYPEWSPEAKS